MALFKISKKTADQQPGDSSAPNPTPADMPAPAPGPSTAMPPHAGPTPSGSVTVSTRPGLARSSASEPNLSSRARVPRVKSDLSIDSVLMKSQPAPLPTLKPIRHTDFNPNMYTYDPTKAPPFQGRKRERAHRSRSSPKASSCLRSPRIETMAEENEGEDMVTSSSNSTKSASSGSSSRSQYLEMKRSANQQQAHPHSYGSISSLSSDASAVEALPMSPARTDSEPQSPAATETEHPTAAEKPKKRTWFGKKLPGAAIAAH